MPLSGGISTAISQRKSNFLKSISDDTFEKKADLRQLRVRDLSLMASYYAKKYGIKIYVEGLLPLDMLMHSNSTHMIISRAYDEMRDIQQSLKKDEYAGYIYTDLNCSLYSKQIDEAEKRHCEVFIISKGSVIQPICWNIKASIPVPKFEGGSSASTDLSQFFGFLKGAQSSIYECGALGLAYLKDLLKDDASQFQNDSLVAPIYIEKLSRVELFFFPSPQVLRYSQSECYNEFFAAMIEGKENFTHKGKQYTVPSLTKLLEHTVRVGLPEQRVRATSILSCLPEFRMKWLEKYAEIKSKRGEMQLKFNTYLSYTAERITKTVYQIELEKNPGREIIALLKDTPFEDQKTYLVSNLSRIKFACRFELVFFLSQFNLNLYSHVLKYIDFSSLNTVAALSTALDIYFTNEQRTGFIRCLHVEENFRRLQFKEIVINKLDAFLCFNMQDIRGERLFDFIRATCDKNNLSESIKACILDEIRCYHLHSLLDKLNSDSSIERQKYQYVVQFLKEYVGTDWLVQKKSELLNSRGWKEIAAKFFETKEEFERFNRENLQIRKTARPSIGNYPDRLFPSSSSGSPSTATSNMQSM